MSDENEKLSGKDDPDKLSTHDPDFEGQKLTHDKLAPATEEDSDADFEGHKLTHDKPSEKLDG